MDENLSEARARTPRAAAIAGMLFSMLSIATFWLLHAALPADPHEEGAWLATSSRSVAAALNLVPFSGIAFLWFIGVLRDRLGRLEDRFFSTVFFGSGLLFLAMLFIASGVTGAILITFAGEPGRPIESATFALARAAAYNLVNIYMMKMAAVFMIATSTVAVYTRFAPRWLAFSGYALALVLLLGSYYITWGFLVFPVWVFLLSSCILFENFRWPWGGRDQERLSPKAGGRHWQAHNAASTRKEPKPISEAAAVPIAAARPCSARPLPFVDRCGGASRWQTRS